jgi:hypothetical protein
VKKNEVYYKNMSWFTSSAGISRGKRNLINRAEDKKVYTPYMRNRINKIKTAAQLKEVSGELTGVIWGARKEKETLENEARMLGIYTNFKNKINNHDSTRGSFFNIRQSIRKYARNKKSASSKKI